MHSIRIFLIASILATLTLFNFIAALRGYQSSMREAETLFDNQLLDLSHLVSRLNLQELDDDFRMGNNSEFQIWQGDELIAFSSNAANTSLISYAPGFANQNFNSYRWRTYSRYEASKDQWVIVAERTDLRFVLAENVVLAAVYPILLGIPLVGLLIWLIISRGLRPLKELSGELRDKQATDLSPLHYKNSKKELKQMVQATNSFIRRLSAALEREKRFSADAAHELRTPVSALKIQLHNLSEELDSDSELFLQLESGVERMQHVIEQLLALYRTTPDQFDRDAKKVDLYQLTQDVLVQYFPAIEKKQHSLELIGQRHCILGDKFALETMISNLISNANKYTGDGGKIIVRIDADESRVLLSVEDNGRGISEKDASRVFDRFYRSSSRVDRDKMPGCGLGLTIVSHVAELHQAELSFEKSTFASGCLFSVSFKKHS